MNELECPYCGRLGKNRNSAGQHSCRCPDNPNRKVQRGGKPPQKPWNKGLTKETSEVIKKRSNILAERYRKGELVNHQKGKARTEEERAKISEAMKGNQNANHRGDRQTRYKNIRMDSRWEAAVAYHLDRIEATWVYNERGFKLSDGRYYYPDFFLYKKTGEFSHLIEVKGYFREANKAKFELFRKEYPEIHIVLWFQDKLTKLGLLTCDGYTKVN